MKILVVYPYIPYPLNRGAYYRAFHLLKGLAREHTVDLLALAENFEGIKQKDVFAEFCREVEFIPFQHPEWERLFPKRLFNSLPSTVAHWTVPAVREAIRQRLGKHDYDAVHLCDIVLAQYFLKEFREIPLVIDRTRVDLQYQLMEQKRMRFSFKNRLLNLENLAKLWAFEKVVAQRSRLQVVCGPDDESFTRQYISGKVPISVIPNGVDLEYFQPCHLEQLRDSEPTLLFCGAMDYNPNIDALRWYFSEIHGDLKQAVPDLRILIVGKDPVQEVVSYGKLPSVTVTGGVPDVRPYYQRAWMQMVPLRIGGGTRLKIVESMAMGTPVISTTIGAQGLDLTHEHDILLADSAETFARECARSLQDEMLRRDLRQHGIETVQSRLSWEKLGADLTRSYREVFPKCNNSQVPEPMLTQ
ncbi:MAG: glycosyltransferase [Verrucomicrobiota bacterium]|nr:glycosyltransferase [Verrucomicrobiota bacterium]